MSIIFADNPAKYFGSNAWDAQHHPREEIEALQLKTIQRRFADLKNKLPPLKALAEAFLEMLMMQSFFTIQNYQYESRS